MLAFEIGANTRTRPKRVPIEEHGAACRFIAATVASVMGEEVEELLGPKRGPARVALARGAAMYLAHVALEMTLTEVGRVFGRDRTTVSHACARIEDARETEGFDKVLCRIEKALGWGRVFLGTGQ